MVNQREMNMFNSYVKLPEGFGGYTPQLAWFDDDKTWNLELTEEWDLFVGNGVLPIVDLQDIQIDDFDFRSSFNG
jgi:hypothetical protein